MLLILHIIAAVGSLVAAGIVYFMPSSRKLHLTYGLTSVMLASGTLLVIKNSAHLIEACLMGLSMLAVIAYAVYVARHKMAVESTKI